MNTCCPNGHLSTEPDYCSECGLALGPAPADLLALPVAPGPASGAPICPDCGTDRPAGGRFCELCRHDFVAAADPATTAPAAAALAVPAAAPIPASGTRPGPGPDPASSTPLDAIVMVGPLPAAAADPAWPCPVGTPDLVFPLDLAENLVGRRSEGQRPYPEVAVRDPAVSVRHLKLLRGPDGVFLALELGSSNGTQLNGAPLNPGELTPVGAGDELTLGLWTRIRLAARWGVQ